MKSGVLKQLFIEYPLQLIKVQFGDLPTSRRCTVVDIKFDTTTRTHILLRVKETPHSRYNKTQAIKTFILDFKDTHEVLVIDGDREERVYPLSGDYTIENNEVIFKVGIPGETNKIGLKRNLRLP
jgi:hypothetical protein